MAKTDLRRHSEADLALFRREAGLGVCSDPRPEFGRDYRILALLDELERLRGAVDRVEAVDLRLRRLGMAFQDPWREGWNRALEVAQDDLRAALAGDADE